MEVMGQWSDQEPLSPRLATGKSPADYWSICIVIDILLFFCFCCAPILVCVIIIIIIIIIIETAGENTCSQKRASCLGNSRREREAFSSILSAAGSTREASYEQMCHLLSHQRRLEAETPAMSRGKHV